VSFASAKSIQPDLLLSLACVAIAVQAVAARFLGLTLQDILFPPTEPATGHGL
jgi:hypothetical protein